MYNTVAIRCKSEKYRELLIKDLMMNPNIDSLHSLMQNLYILQSDNITKKARNKRERLNAEKDKV